MRPQPAHVPPVARDLAHSARGQEAVFRRRHDEDGLELRVEHPVELRLLELRLEIRARPQALDDHPGPPLAGEVYEQTVDDLDRDVLQRPCYLLDEPRPVLRGEPRSLFHVLADRHHDVIVDVRGSPDAVEVTDGDRVEATGTDREFHGVLWSFKEGYNGATVAAAGPFQALRGLHGRRVAALDNHPSAGRKQGRQTFEDAPDLPRRDFIRGGPRK